MPSKKTVALVIEILNELYPDSKPELNFTSPYELLIAVILSAQCTDVRVNKVTEILFKRANTPTKMVDLGIDAIEEIIKPCGIYKNKAKNIYDTSKKLMEIYSENVPSTMEELIQLPGVGRKTANVVLSNAFDTPAIAVDTHVFRVSNRIGISNAKNVDETEIQLMKIINRDMWTKAHHLLIFHGRRVCKARNPECEKCDINPYCRYYTQNRKGVK